LKDIQVNGRSEVICRGVCYAGR